MASFTIGGRTYSGSSVTIIAGRVTVDGVVQDASLAGIVEIRVTEGILGELHTDASVSCGQVQGNVTAGGTVSCDDVGGCVAAGGSVSCGDVRGSVKAGGSVVYG